MPLRLVELPAKDSTSALDPLAALSRSAALGSAHAIDTLVLSVTPAMLRAVRGVLGADHLEVEDVLQESAIGLVGALKTFRGESTVLHFACRIAVLTAITARRRLGERGNDRIHISEDLPVPSSESFTHRFGPRGPPSRRLARAHRYASGGAE
jgi:DNA-directed RNA polymerase specialized sigma24 family protein